MEMGEITSPRNIYLGVEAGSVKRVLQLIAEEASAITGLAPLPLMDGLIEREKLGSTSLGLGVSIPHARYDGLDRVYGIFMRLEQPVDVLASDGKPADMFFAILAPSHKQADHARLLSRITRILSDEITCERLRHTSSIQEVYDTLTAEDEVAQPA